jgi:branched-chain amino acid aminotransferase
MNNSTNVTAAPVAGTAFVSGVYVPLAEAAIPILDRGFLRSDATYDVVHVWKGKFFRLGDHIDRFFRSMRALRMTLPYSGEAIASILTECVRKSGLRDAYVQMTCTRGVPPTGTRDPRLCINRFYAFAQPFVWIADENQRRVGLKMIVSSVERIPPESLDPRIKNFHWLDLTMGVFEAYDRSATIAVLNDRHGNITEGAGFNVFVLSSKGELTTPDGGMFEGITRRTILEACERVGISARSQPVSVAALSAAEEIFLTSTAGGVMPVVELNGEKVGAGLPGPITSKLRDAYWNLHDDPAYCTPIQYVDER